jgi:Domain of unknown function (DUF4198)
VTIRRSLAVLAAMLVSAVALQAHTLFLKLDSYFLQPNTAVRIPVLNGEFMASEGGVTRDRLRDISVLSPSGRRHVDTLAWTAMDTISFLDLRVGGPGTYVAGASTRAREISLAAEDFNAYLDHDGVPTILDARRRAGELGKAVVERYEKHVKAVFQVGDRRTGGWDVPFGYPAEIVLLSNPYTLSVGDTVRIRCLVDGESSPNQTFLAGGERNGVEIPELRGQADPAGEAAFVLSAPGKWYVHFIKMVPSDLPNIDYHSKWTTVTFEIR